MLSELPTLYDILGVDPKARPTEVKSAYRNLARSCHPDINPDPQAHERMAAINAAFEVLNDPVRRSEYDAAIGQGLDFDPFMEQDASTRPAAVRVRIAHRLRRHRTPVYAASYARNTGRLVSCSFDNELLYWDERFREPERRVKLEGGVVSHLAAPSDRLIVAAGSTEQSLACWTVRPEGVRVWRHTPKDWVCCVCVSPDGKSLALGTVGKEMHVVRTDNGAPRFKGLTHVESVTALAWSADSGMLATGSADASVKLWCGRTGRELRTLTRIISTVTSLAFSPDGEWLAVAAVDLSVRVFNLRDWRLHKTLFGHQKPVEAMAFHPRSWLLGTASRDGCIGLWNVVQGIGHGRIEASHHPLSCLTFSPDGVWMASGGLDKHLRVWSLSLPR